MPLAPLADALRQRLDPPNQPSDFTLMPLLILILAIEADITPLL